VSLDSTSRWDSVLLFIRPRVSLGPTSLRRALHLVVGLVARLLRLHVGLAVVLLGPAACRWAHCLSVGPTLPRSARCVVNWPIVSSAGPPSRRSAHRFVDWHAVSLIGCGLAHRIVSWPAGWRFAPSYGRFSCHILDCLLNGRLAGVS